MQTISSGTGSSVSMADAKGWINSGQLASHTQSMVLQLEQKARSEVQRSWFGVPRSLIALYFLVPLWAGIVYDDTVATHDTYLILFSPCKIFILSAIPPRFTAPMYPPTLRQMLQAHSWKGTGVFDCRVNSTSPHWQLPSSFLSSRHVRDDDLPDTTPHRCCGWATCPTTGVVCHQSTVEDEFNAQ